MESRYNPAEIEEKWQKTWAEQGLHQTVEDAMQPKFYALSMFPYPSGNLHMGHVRVYTIVDVIARVRRMQGYRVLNPMGWDAFGLPAENAAIERGIPPATWTYQNIDQMRQQLDQLGISFDWERQVTTCSPNYYQWTQWIFLQFFQAGLAYQKEATVNWDPIDQTVLANEQVDSEGKSWRSGAKVERKQLRQWFLKITDYAEQLLNDLDKLTGWPEKVRLMQANWIGKSTGAQVSFKTEAGDEIVVFTTRPDTLWGATFMVLSPEHPLVEKLTTKKQAKLIQQYQAEAASKSDIDRTAEGREKTGVWTGSYAINPVNDEKIPIWIADYVLMDYGTGAIMAVPAHDQRDFEFAQTFNLPIKVVVQPPDQAIATETMTAAHAGDGVMVNSGPLNGVPAGKEKGQSVEAAVAWLEQHGKGKGMANYRLRDWLISRQRYWGAPIPIIHCPQCGAVPVPDQDLPVRLPEEVEFSGRGPSPLAKLDNWINVPCPTCGRPAKRETDTMDTFIDSSWYFLRYPDASNEQQAFDPQKTNDWMPVDQYVGGIEHAILHLLYSRFFTKVLRDRGLLNFDEPFQRLLTQGMVQGRTYKNPKTGKYVVPMNITDFAHPIDPETGDALEVVYEKMSKSKYNGVAPGDVVNKYGADTARMFILFKAPPEKDLEWDEADVEGQFRFLNRVWRLVTEFVVWNTIHSAFVGRNHVCRSDYTSPYIPQPETTQLLQRQFDILIADAELGIISIEQKFVSIDDLTSGRIDQWLQQANLSLQEQINVWTEEYDQVQHFRSARAIIALPFVTEAQWLRKFDQLAELPPIVFGDQLGNDDFLARINQIHPQILASEPIANNLVQLISSLLGSQDLTRTEKNLRRAIHTAIQAVTEDLEGEYQFNTAVSELMKLSNALTDAACKDSPVYAEGIKALLILLAPFAPHIAEELWLGLGHTDSIHRQSWLTVDPAALVADEITLVIQINGKTRGALQASAQLSKEELEQFARESDIAQKYIEGKTIKKAIVVPGKLVNFVVG